MTSPRRSRRIRSATSASTTSASAALVTSGAYWVRQGRKFPVPVDDQLPDRPKPRRRRFVTRLHTLQRLAPKQHQRLNLVAELPVGVAVHSPALPTRASLTPRAGVEKDRRIRDAITATNLNSRVSG